MTRESRHLVGGVGRGLDGDERIRVGAQPVHRRDGRKLQTPTPSPRRPQRSRAQRTLQPYPRVVLALRRVHHALVRVRRVLGGARDERVAFLGGHVPTQPHRRDGIRERRRGLRGFRSPFGSVCSTLASSLPGRHVERLDGERVVTGLGRQVLRLFEHPLRGVDLTSHGWSPDSQRRAFAVQASGGPAPAATGALGLRQAAHRAARVRGVLLPGLVIGHPGVPLFALAVDALAFGVVLQLPRRQVQGAEYPVQVPLQVLGHRDLPRAERGVHRAAVDPSIPSPEPRVEDAVEVAHAALHPDVVAPRGPSRLHRERGRHLLEVRLDERDALLVRRQLRHLSLREVLAVRRRVRIGDARQRPQDGVSILTNREGHRVPRGLRGIVADLPPPRDVADLHVRLAHPQHGDRPRRLERRQRHARQAEEAQEQHHEAPRARSLVPRAPRLDGRVLARDEQDSLIVRPVRIGRSAEPHRRSPHHTRTSSAPRLYVRPRHMSDESLTTAPLVAIKFVWVSSYPKLGVLHSRFEFSGLFGQWF